MISAEEYVQMYLDRASGALTQDQFEERLDTEGVSLAVMAEVFHDPRFQKVYVEHWSQEALDSMLAVLESANDHK